jgi:integrase
MSAYITKRKSKNGPRWVVRYRLGGRMTPLQHAGSFKTQRAARARLEAVIAELAAGRNPADMLLAQQAPAPAPMTLAGWFDQFIYSRVDTDPSTLKSYRNTRDRLRSLSRMFPHEVRPADIQTWIAENSDLAASTLGKYKSVLNLVFDFADVEPNPARSAKVRMPKRDKAEIDPPSTVEWQAMKPHLPKRSSLVVRWMECNATRVDCEALNLTCGDIDFANGRVRIVKTKGRTAGRRWLFMPQELLDEIAELVPLEDRHPDRKVWPNLTDDMVRRDMEKACNLAGIAKYTPHDLRHRRCSLWYAQLLDAVGLIRWSGHSKSQVFLENYAHVILDPEADEWKHFWHDAWQRRREVPVRFQDA